MNNPHDWLPEIVAAFERDGLYFGVVELNLGGATRAFEFGVCRNGYKTLRKVIQERPFENLTVGPYRYYFVPNVRRLDEEGVAEFAVRIVQGRNGKNFSFKGPVALVANLTWFQRIKDFREAGHLTEMKPK